MSYSRLNVTRPGSAPTTAPEPPAILPVASRYLRAGQTVAGRYDVLERLGVGGMGAVYRVYDRSLSEEVALKVLRLDLASDPRTLAHFHHETRLARKISHPNVCRVFDLGEADGFVFLTMELLPGETLRTRIARGPGSLAERLRLFEQVARGLAAAHAQGILHRDLKPENVLMRGDGTAVVADFGLALVPGESSASSDVAGTPLYMSPEQLRGETLDARSDVFALGLLGCELLTGKRPFGDGPQVVVTTAILRDPPVQPAFSGLDSEVAGALVELLLLALNKDPAERWQSAAAMANATAEARAVVAGGSAFVEAPRRSRFAMHPTPGVILLAALVSRLLDGPAAMPPEWPQPGRQNARVEAGAVRSSVWVPPATPSETRFERPPLASYPLHGRFGPASEGALGGAPAPEPEPLKAASRTLSFPNPPVKVKMPLAVRQIGSGQFAAFVTVDGAIWLWQGANPERMHKEHISFPPSMSGSDMARFVGTAQDNPPTLVPGGRFPLLIGADGTVAMGSRETRRLRRLPQLSNVIAAAAGERHVVALHQTRTASLAVVDDGLEHLADPLPISGLFNVAAVAGGGLNSAALLSNGEILSWGYDIRKERRGPALELIPAKIEIVRLEKRPPLPGGTALAFWQNILLALDRDGTVHLLRGRSWGSVLGLPRIAAISAWNNAAAALDVHGAVWAWGSFGAGLHSMKIASPEKVEGLPSIMAALVSELQSFAIDANGELWVWGQCMPLPDEKAPVREKAPRQD